MSISEITEKWVVWCNLNAEQDALEKLFGDDCVSIRGDTPLDERIEMEQQWREGDVPIMLTKPMLFGFGLNWQHCCKMIFFGLSDSFEETYQAERRIWRFGQASPVEIYVVTSELEGAVVRNIERKEAQHHALMDGLVAHMRTAMQQELGATVRQTDDYAANKIMQLPTWVRSEAA